MKRQRKSAGRNVSSAMPVAKYYARIFCKRRRPLAPETVRCGERAIAALSTALKRPATLADLNDFEPRVSNRSYAERLAAIRTDFTRRRAVRLSRKEAGSLMVFFEHVSKPKLAEVMGPRTLREYRQSIVLLAEFLGHTPKVAELTEAQVDDFRSWLVQVKRYSSDYARKRWQRVRRVLRDARPGHFRQRVIMPAPQSATPAGSLREFFECVYVPRRLVGRSPAAVRQYRIALRQLATYFGRDPLVSELNDELLAGYLQWLLDNGCAAVTVNKRRGAIAAFWRAAHDAGLIGTLPRVRKLREAVPVPDSWSAAELQRIIAACQLESGSIGEIPSPAFWTALMLVVYYTGLRRTAVLGLRRSDVNRESGWLTARAELQKNLRGKRFKLGDDALAAIGSIWKPHRTLLFPLPWSDPVRPLSDRWDRILTRAGLPIGRREKFHKLRRTSATLVAMAGGTYAAMQHLGHSEEYVTQRYIDPSKLPQNDATQYLPSLLQVDSRKGSR